jgi:hypothetical protein
MRPRTLRWQAALLFVLASVAVAGWRLPPATGLQVELFPNDSRTGPPAHRYVSSEVTLARVSRMWEGRRPSVFSGRWSGYLIVPRAGTYTFSLTSDDGSTLKIDDTLVVDNGGNHASQTKSGQIALSQGPHAVLIEYTQAGGAYEIDWRWAYGDGPAEAIPAAVLSPSRMDHRMASVVRWLDALFLPALLGCGVLIVFIAFPARA